MRRRSSPPAVTRRSLLRGTLLLSAAAWVGTQPGLGLGHEPPGVVHSVDRWYADFTQTTDDEVRDLLE